jgi:hypothetical protein
MRARTWCGSTFEVVIRKLSAGMKSLKFFDSENMKNSAWTFPFRFIRARLNCEVDVFKARIIEFISSWKVKSATSSLQNNYGTPLGIDQGNVLWAFISI